MTAQADKIGIIGGGLIAMRLSSCRV